MVQLDQVIARSFPVSMLRKWLILKLLYMFLNVICLVLKLSYTVVTIQYNMKKKSAQPFDLIVRFGYFLSTCVLVVRRDLL